MSIVRRTVWRALCAVLAALAFAAGVAPLTRVDQALDERPPADRPWPLLAPDRGSPGRAAAPDPADADGDGIADVREDLLAEKFAPIVLHSAHEVAYPVNVDWWLARTSLWLYDERATPPSRLMKAGPLTQADLVAAAGGDDAALPASRSRMKKRSLFLADVPTEFRRGAADPSEWTTYVHAYPNQHGGVTLQYWRAYSWNDASALDFDFSHGGDWEGMAVALDASEAPVAVALLQHAGIAYLRGSVAWEGTHPIIFSEARGHSSEPRPAPQAATIRQETWSGGRVSWPDGVPRRSGLLVNVGERSRPRQGQQFIQYAGLWGAPGRLFITSGYWGPAFNETGAQCDDGAPAYRFTFGYPSARPSCGRIVMTAWCDGMAAGPLDPTRECSPALDLP